MDTSDVLEVNENTPLKISEIRRRYFGEEWRPSKRTILSWIKVGIEGVRLAAVPLGGPTRIHYRVTFRQLDQFFGRIQTSTVGILPAQPRRKSAAEAEAVRRTNAARKRIDALAAKYRNR